MQGPTVKTYFAKKMGLDPEKIVHVALTPCTAKKFEIRRGELHGAADHLGIPGLRDTDQVITTRELVRWTKAEGVDWNALEDSAYDSLMGQASGAGVIFGNTGESAPPEPAEPDPGSRVRGRAGDSGGNRRPDASGCGGLRHCQHPDLPAAYEGKRQAVPFRGGHGLPRRLHRRRSAQEHHAGCGRNPQTAHCRPLPAGRLHGAAHQPREPGDQTGLRGILRSAPQRDGRADAAHQLPGLQQPAERQPVSGEQPPFSLHKTASTAKAPGLPQNAAGRGPFFMDSGCDQPRRGRLGREGAVVRFFWCSRRCSAAS